METFPIRADYESYLQYLAWWIYYLGAQSHIYVSFNTPKYTGDITGIGATRLLEAIRRSGIKAASSSELFGASL